MKTYQEYKESLLQEKENLKKSFTSKELKKLNDNEESPLFSIDIQLDEENTKKFEVYSFDELDEKLNIFCEENNIPENAKKYIYDSIKEKLGQHEEGCKYIFYICFSSKFIRK